MIQQCQLTTRIYIYRFEPPTPGSRGVQLHHLNQPPAVYLYMTSNDFQPLAVFLFITSSDLHNKLHTKLSVSNYQVTALAAVLLLTQTLYRYLHWYFLQTGYSLTESSDREIIYKLFHFTTGSYTQPSHLEFRYYSTTM